MRKPRRKYNKLQLEKALENAAAMLSAKGTSFDHLMSDPDVFRLNSRTLVAFIERKSKAVEQEHLFSILLEMLIMLKTLGVKDHSGFIREQKRVAAARARRVRAQESEIINSIIAEALSSLYLRKPIRRRSATGAANDIIEQVNSDLARRNIKPLRTSAISKRIKHIDDRTSGQSSD